MDRLDAATAIVRIVFGVFLAVHGANKLRSGLAGTASWFGSIGMRWPRAQALTAASSEIVAGLMFAAGFLTALSASAVVAVMTVAIVTVHARVGFFIFLPDGGWEYCASIATVAAAVAVGGAGRFSLDHLLGTGTGPLTGVMIVLAGVLLASVHLAATWRPGSPA